MVTYAIIGTIISFIYVMATKEGGQMAKASVQRVSNADIELDEDDDDDF